MRSNFDQGDEKLQSDLDPSPKVDVKISNLINEINDFAVGVLRAEIKSSEEMIGCKRLLQQVHNGNVKKLPSPKRNTYHGQRRVGDPSKVPEGEGDAPTAEATQGVMNLYLFKAMFPVGTMNYSWNQYLGYCEKDLSSFPVRQRCMDSKRMTVASTGPLKCWLWKYVVTNADVDKGYALWCLKLITQIYYVC